MVRGEDEAQTKDGLKCFSKKNKQIVAKTM